MRSAENIEKLIKNIDIDTNAKVDEAVLDDVLKALEKSKNKKSAIPQPNVWRIIMKSKIAKIAAAAAIIVATCLFFIHHSPNGKIETPQIAQTTESPAELITLVSLNIAFRDGDMEAVEEQFDKAEKKVRPGLKERLTIDQLLCELEECEET